MVGPGAPRRRHFLERCRLRGRKTVLAGLNSSRAGVASSGGRRPTSHAPRERPMTTMRLDDLRQYSDVLRARNGEVVTVRFVEPRDAEALQNYFRSLTTRSRYNRFLGAASELPPSLLEDFIHIGELDRFSVIATMLIEGHE